MVVGCGVAGLVLVATALLMPSRRRVHRMAWLSAFTALVCLRSTVFVRVCVGADESVTGVPGTVVSDTRQTSRVLDRQKMAGRERIPTGLLIETLQFNDTYNVRLIEGSWDFGYSGLSWCGKPL